VSVTPQVAYANDLPIERGALVLRIEPGGAAEAAGITPGDVITAVAGRPVTDLHHFHDLLARHPIGDSVEITLWRAGGRLTVTAVLEEYR
jgi:serine protease Do